MLSSVSVEWFLRVGFFCCCYCFVLMFLAYVLIFVCVLSLLWAPASSWGKYYCHPDLGLMGRWYGPHHLPSQVPHPILCCRTRSCPLFYCLAQIRHMKPLTKTVKKQDKRRNICSGSCVRLQSITEGGDREVWSCFLISQQTRKEGCKVQAGFLLSVFSLELRPMGQCQIPLLRSSLLTSPPLKSLHGQTERYCNPINQHRNEWLHQVKGLGWAPRMNIPLPYLAGMWSSVLGPTLPCSCSSSWFCVHFIHLSSRVVRMPQSS